MSAPRFPPGYAVAGKYTIRSLITYGGASATYVAAGPAGRDVVVRITSPDLAARADVVAAIQRATAVTNQLPPDAVLPVVDGGFDPQTRAPYAVTELATLPSLAQEIARGAFSLADVALLLRGVARAVDAAHAQRLAHGALKPENIFVGAAPDRPVRVADFGASTPRAAFPTNEGYALAVPWIAPEQLQGGAPGPAVDVFSAALVAFFAATGKSYWLSCQAASPDLARWQQESAAPRVAASARARELGVNLPPLFDDVFARALAPDPGARFASVGELAAALARGGASVVAVAAPMEANAAAMDADPVLPPRRSRTGLYVLLALVGVGVLGGVVALVVTSRGPKPDAAASASALAATTPPSAAVAPSAAPPPPSATASATPSAAPSQDAPSSPEAAELTIVCTPECDSISIDDTALKDNLSDPVQLPAGPHTLTVGKASYATQSKKVTLKPGQSDKVAFFLYKPSAAPPPPKRCGKFLERCP